MSRELQTPKSGEAAGEKSPARRIVAPESRDVAGKQTGGVNSLTSSSQGVGFERDFSRVPARASDRSGLKVGSPDDAHEREADRAAEAVMSMTGATQMASSGLTQTARAGATQAKSRADAGAVHDTSTTHGAHESLTGESSPLPDHVRAFFEPRFGSDFSGVRVHADAHASRSARALNARAYTLGRDIVFGAGEYRPETSSGRNLLAHELAHVVQQGGSSAGEGGSAGLQIRRRLRGSQTAPATIQRAIKTWAGDWDTSIYKTLSSGGVDEGVHIKLHFKPGDKVDASNIAMIQTANSKDLGKVIAINPTVVGRSIPAGKTGEGVHIDQYKGVRNPIYDVDATTAKDTALTDAAVGAFGERGYRYTDAAGVFREHDAILEDKPRLPGHGADASQIFETTATAISGVQTGTYYGSVRWGWKSDAAGKFTRLSLSKISDDAPSGTFATAAGLWNKGATDVGDPNLKFTVALRRFINAADVLLVGDPKNAAGSTVEKLPVDTRVEVTNKGWGKDFNKGAAATHWWRVTVVEGIAAGKVGWVMASQLSKTKSTP
ncbi:MAG TPA: DUF4157 domain-containing protein [Pyrinomonadaceae bacterium]|nr:DUF4157 domain-containing protein [Pyrinomonadaceae bacterium]